MSRLQIITTGDNSHSLFLPELDEHYHSTHGAVQESTHVFIEAGLKQIKGNAISILEVGFGTGLNALLSLIHAVNQEISISYTGVEKYPLTETTYSVLNYGTHIEKGKFQKEFSFMHASKWNFRITINPTFELRKIKADILEVDFSEKFDLVYFDAFAPSKQPEMWERRVFEPIIDALKPDGVITTYAATGQVRRLWKELGLKVERLPGPPGKREMLRAIKMSDSMPERNYYVGKTI